jgi:hypothetical protein
MNANETSYLSAHWARVFSVLSAPFIAGGAAYTLAPEGFKMAATFAATVSVAAAELGIGVYLVSKLDEARKEMEENAEPSGDEYYTPPAHLQKSEPA